MVSTRCTQMYTDQLMSYSWLGVSIWLPLHIWGPTTNPRTAIQPGVMPGECWAFKGHEGYLVIKLSMPMKPTRFSMEHIPKSLSPNGKIDSAPKDFAGNTILISRTFYFPIILVFNLNILISRIFLTTRLVLVGH